MLYAVYAMAYISKCIICGCINIIAVIQIHGAEKLEFNFE